jgi:hypothetical protein
MLAGVCMDYCPADATDCVLMASDTNQPMQDPLGHYTRHALGALTNFAPRTLMALSLRATSMPGPSAPAFAGQTYEGVPFVVEGGGGSRSSCYPAFL